MIDLDHLQREVGETCAKFRPADGERNALADALIVAEEAGEVCRASLKRWHGNRPAVDWAAELRIEVADTAIALLSLAENEGWSLAGAIAERWEEVRNR